MINLIMETTDQNTKGIKQCNNYLDLIEKITGIRPAVGICTSFNLKTEIFDIAAVGNDGKLALSVMESSGKRIVSEQLRAEGFQSNPGWIRLSDYFTPKNLKNTTVEAEHGLLLENHYEIDAGFYYAITLPPQTDPVERVFFLVAKDKQEQKIFNQYLDSILEKIG